MRSADDVIAFWFDQHSQDDWFGGKPEFDAAIAARFAQTHAAVARGEASSWRSSPEGRLAEIVVLDQFSRQLFRQRPEAFAQDKMALVLAQEAIAAGADQAVGEDRRMFFYLPFMHAESLLVQDEGVRLYEELGVPELLDYMRAHRDTVARFGRFPFRNTALGRVGTPEEIAYIAEAGDRGF
jgi:uncharacterized protein (DUF924 family)